jgi:hypothetical protein
VKTILAINLFAALFAAVLPNEFLAYNSYLFYGLQLFTMVPYLVRKAGYIKNLFLPTFFVLIYFLVSMTFGSYLVPRDYGWDKQFADVATDIRTYRLIVPFFMLSSIVLFVLSAKAFDTLARAPYHDPPGNLQHVGLAPGAGLAKIPFYFAAFFAVSYFDIYSAFSFQLALLILHLTDPALRRRWYRYSVYLFYLGVKVGLSYENKREIVMVLFLITFLECYYGRLPLRFTFKSVAGYILIGVSFFALVLAASILRGYGDFPVASIIDAFSYIPGYMSSEMFVDGITDNLELNYSYGVSIAAVDHALRGVIPYQYGGSLIKVFFLPIPRDAIPFKPDSILQIFTQIYAPEWWLEGGSMPVVFSADMFLNFNYLGLVPYALVWWVINRGFLRFHIVSPQSFIAYSCVFFFISVMMFARGSGIEQWLLYYLLAAPVFFLAGLAHKVVRAPALGGPRWVI